MRRIREATTGSIDSAPSPVDYSRTFGEDAYSVSAPDLMAKIDQFAADDPRAVRQIYKVMRTEAEV